MYIRVIGKDIKEFYDKDVILFGCGSCGIRTLEEFQKVGANIIGFADNNKELHGKKVNGYNVINPDQLKFYHKANIIISSTYDIEIEEQLKIMNISNYYRIKLGVLRETLPKEDFCNRILNDCEVNNMIFDKLEGTDPFFIGRLGSVELECLSHYLYLIDRNSTKKQSYPDNVKMMMNINAGFFPSNDKLLDEFNRLYIECLDKMDVIWSMWFSKFEDMIYRDYFKSKLLADYHSTAFPIDSLNPWTTALRGKKILVIHPFDVSIKQNYQLRKELFGNMDFIPEFELITLKAVQSIANTKTEYNSWFEALKDMEEKICNIDFDIALIGAGAYGLALGAFIKDLGKKAVHVGGMLQLFFGIRGKAWDKLNIYNDYWTSPKEEEKPNGYKLVESGRYW
jgi:hypothetical protein